MTTDLTREKERFEKKYIPEPMSGCWIWIGKLNTGGYGRFPIKGMYRTAHRISWSYRNGEIPNGMQLDHLCRNRQCVNPDHLEPVTAQENSLRSDNVSGVNARKTHCIHGHEFSGENLGTQKGKYRFCRECQRKCDREWKRNARRKS